jgi:hypothetical protein
MFLLTILQTSTSNQGSYMNIPAIETHKHSLCHHQLPPRARPPQMRQALLKNSISKSQKNRLSLASNKAA